MNSRQKKVVENFAPNINHISDQVNRPLATPIVSVCVGLHLHIPILHLINLRPPTHTQKHCVTMEDGNSGS